MSFEIVCCLALNDVKVYDHIMPLSLHPSIEKIWIIRSSEQNYKPIPKAEYIVISSKFKLLRFFKMFIACYKIGKSQTIKAYVSFNPIPYGLIASIAAKLNKKPIHLGFIGSDWNLHCKGFWGPLLRKSFKKASFFTATGNKMKDEMAGYGFNKKKISILPHSIDLNHFYPKKKKDNRYDCVFIGNLIKLKNVSVILKAFYITVNKFPCSKLYIIGDGPLKQSLETEAEALGISKAVEFTGFVPDIEPYLAKSKILIIASSDEGFPFVIVEAIATGVIPVSTPVGTIPDFLQDEETALFFRVGDPKQLADKLARLMENKDLHDKLKDNIIKLRESFSFEKATAVWDKWLQELDC